MTSLTTLAVTLAALAVVEYLAHRLVMHHECPPLRGAFDRHHVQHHRLGRLDVNVDAPAWFYLSIGSPALAALALAGLWAELATAAATIAAYAWLWTGVHRAIHDLGGRWATFLPFYPALRRHHLAHHARPGRNFGALFGPLLDAPLGTRADGRRTRPACEPLEGRAAPSAVAYPASPRPAPTAAPDAPGVGDPPIEPPNSPVGPAMPARFAPHIGGFAGSTGGPPGVVGDSAQPAAAIGA